MRFRIEQRLPAPVAVVEAAMLDPSWYAVVAAADTVARPTLLEKVEDGDKARIRVRYLFRANLNAAVRRAIDPSKLTWVDEQLLDRSSHTSTFRIVPDHYANRMRSSGTFQLVPDGVDGDQTLRTCDAEVKVSAPFVGGQVELAIVSGLRQHAKAEVALFAGWLAAR